MGFGILSKSDTNYSGWRPTHSGKSEMTHQKMGWFIQGDSKCKGIIHLI